MIYGHFDDSSREYVITDPATPWPWINYLGTEDFFSLISATAGGYCFCRDARYRRILRYRYNGVPMDSGGRYFYINDGGSVWSPGWKPCRTPLDYYECRHGMGYTRITGEKDGLRASALFFVPIGHRCEVHKVTLTNTGSGFKSFSLYSFVEWCLWNASTDMENFQRNLSIGEVEIEDGVIYHKTEYRERRNHYAFYGVNVPVDGFDTDRDSFLGPYNGFDAPRAVVEDNPGMSVAHGWSPVASHCIDIFLEPGETKDVIFVLGYVENAETMKFISPTGREISSGSGIINKKKAYAMMDAFRTTEDVDNAFSALKKYWTRTLGKFSVSSNVPELDRMVNVWNQYQCMVTFNMSRSASFFESGIGRGMGFRDSNQDLAGFVHQIPQKARERILDIAATQFSDGSCYHQYQPLTKKGNNDIGCGFNDDPLWLVFGTIAYLKETGDFSILAEPVKYADSQNSEVPLMDHLFMSLEHVEKNRGPHKLPLIGRADWNDCLNLNCFSENPDESFQTTSNMASRNTESVMIAGLYVFVGKQFVELLRFFEKYPGFVPVSIPDVLRRVYGSASPYLPVSALIERNIHNMDVAVRRSGWAGEWYLRAYDFYGKRVGGRSSGGSKIFIESQGWCAMARIGENRGLCSKALDSVKKMLDCEYGIVLNNPPFTRYYKEFGEISTYPQGYKENAGIFCHNNPWIIIAEVLDGRIDDAWEHYCKISPAFIKDQELHKVEPYVYCQMVAGKDAARPGEGKNSWLTGTAAWNWVAVSEYLLGIHPEYNGLLIKPCLPASIKKYRVHREFRKAVYDITIHNSASGRSTFIPYVPGKHKLVLDL